jgi:hypothetical protein
MRKGPGSVYDMRNIPFGIFKLFLLYKKGGLS